jgi:hypothetical protein
MKHSPALHLSDEEMSHSDFPILAFRLLGRGSKLVVFGLPIGLVPPLPVVPAGFVVELVGGRSNC